MRLFMIAAMALGLAACSAASTDAVHSASSAAATAADAAGVPVPETTTKTIIDEQALTLATKTVSVLADAASALVRVGVIEPHSPTAQTIARGLDDARNGVNAAALAREAVNARSYSEALDKAKAAVVAVQAAINGRN